MTTNKKSANVPKGEVLAAIALALYEEGYDLHDESNAKLTLKDNRKQSAWSLKFLTMRELPQRF